MTTIQKESNQSKYKSIGKKSVNLFGKTKQQSMTTIQKESNQSKCKSV